jgi:hypothetical protein
VHSSGGIDLLEKVAQMKRERNATMQLSTDSAELVTNQYTRELNRERVIH